MSDYGGGDVHNSTYLDLEYRRPWDDHDSPYPNKCTDIEGISWYTLFQNYQLSYELDT
jgi:hypothetical protein